MWGRLHGEVGEEGGADRRDCYAALGRRGCILLLQHTNLTAIVLFVSCICAVLQVFVTFNDRTLNCPGIVSAAREAYNKYYSAEVELNDTFNRFASNYRLAYQGPNTAHAQIGSKFSTSEFVDTVLYW